TELLAALRNTPYGKAPGPDEVYSEALRHISSKGLRFLLRCINHSWTTGTIPVEWRRATIVPLLKPGKSPELLESYRPISLTSVVGRSPGTCGVIVCCGSREPACLHWGRGSVLDSRHARILLIVLSYLCCLSWQGVFLLRFFHVFVYVA
ncbi:L1Tc protein, partial [Trypanosoma cruzi]